MSSSNDTPYEPSLFEITAGVVLSLTLGALLACITLMLRPVEKVRELPAEPKPGVVYYVEGSASSASGRLWQSKRQQFIEKRPGEIVLIEDEINAWARASMEPDAPAGGEEQSMLPVIKTSPPNVMMRENRLQIGLEANLAVYGTEQKAIVQIRGGVRPSGDGFAFVPDDVWVGGLQVSKLPGGSRLVAGRLLSSLVLPEDLTAAWDAVTYAGVEGRQLVLRMP